MAKYQTPRTRARNEDPIPPNNKKQWILALNKVQKTLKLPKFPIDPLMTIRYNYMPAIRQTLENIQVLSELSGDPLRPLIFNVKDFTGKEADSKEITVYPGPPEEWDYDLLQVLELIQARMTYIYEEKYGEGSAELALSAAKDGKDIMIKLAQSTENSANYANATVKGPAGFPTGANPDEASQPQKPAAAAKTRRKASVPPEQPSTPNGVVPAAQDPGLAATQGQTKGKAVPEPAAEQGEPSTGVAQGALTIPPTASKKKSKVTKVPPEQLTTNVPAAQDELDVQAEQNALKEQVVTDEDTEHEEPKSTLEQVEADVIIEQEVPQARQRLIDKLGLIKPNTQTQEIELNEIYLNQKPKFNTVDPWQMCNVESSENPIYRFAFRLTEHEKNNQLFLNPEIFIQILDNLKPKEYRVQMELGELTQKKHYQGFIKLNDKKRAKQLAKELNPVAYGIDVKPARDEFALKAYCTKIETRIKGPWIYPP